MSQFIGVIGAVLFPMIWLVERYRLHGIMDLDDVNLRYVLLYTAGSAVMAAYAFSVRDLPFILFSVSMTMFTATEFVLLVSVKARKQTE